MHFDKTQLPPACLNNLLSLVDKVLKPNVRILEVGCWTGWGTHNICTKIKPFNGIVDVVDTFEGSPNADLKPAQGENIKNIFINNLNEAKFENMVNIHQGKSQEVIPYLNNTYDLVFIDADHSYSNVTQDILNSMNLISHGIICGHDYDNDHYVEEHVEKDYVDGVHHGVTKAVKEIFDYYSVLGKIWWVPL